MALALDKIHRADDADLDRPSPDGNTHEYDQAHGNEKAPSKGLSLHYSLLLSMLWLVLDMP
jgi:hypothetical protein